MNHQSKRIVGRLVVVDVKSNQLLLTRLGITVTKRYGDSHLRNRFKRIVREAFRLARPQLIPGLDFNIKPRSSAKECSSGDIQNELMYFFGEKQGKLSDLKKNKGEKELKTDR